MEEQNITHFTTFSPQKWLPLCSLQYLLAWDVKKDPSTARQTEKYPSGYPGCLSSLLSSHSVYIYSRDILFSSPPPPLFFFSSVFCLLACLSSFLPSSLFSHPTPPPSRSLFSAFRRCVLTRTAESKHKRKRSH